MSRVRPHRDPQGELEQVIRHPAFGRLPDFVIVGAMRCGTTALARYLGAHPDIFMAPEKEVHFFDRHFEEGTDWYARRFARARSEIAIAIGEATQTYMYDSIAVDRMADVVPEAKLIAILREPIDRAYSHYWLNRARGLEPLSFPEAIRAEPERLATSRRDRFVYSYLDRGRYLKQLKMLCGRYPRSALHVAIFESMCVDPRGVYRDVCRHLAVDPAFEPSELGRQINAHVTFRSPGLRRFAKRLPRPMAMVIGRLNVREGGYPPMAGSVRSELRTTFDQEVRQLADWLGRDLSTWLS